MADENIHKGHRQRMLKKYLEHGIECFEEHELLEIFLYSAYTRRNTNDISHNLIKKFGSLEGVLNAGYEELMEVDDVGNTAAAMISFIKDFSKRYSREDFAGIKLDSAISVREFCYNLLKFCSVEEVHVLFLDQTLSLICESQISHGSTDSVEFDLRTIVSKAIKTGCCNLVLAHCHPHGVLLASSSDVSATRRVANSLTALGINLIDHIIVNEENSFSMRAARLLPDIWT